MLKKFSIATYIVLAAAGIVFVLPAHADVIYTFSLNASMGENTGTITGTLDLPFVSPGGSGSGSAASLVLTSIPVLWGTLAGGDTATSWADQVENSFTVTAGVITSVEFFAVTDGTGNANLICLNSTSADPSFGTSNCPSYNNGMQADSTDFAYNIGGLSGITFSQSTIAPEPATIGLMPIGIASLYLIMRRMRIRP